MKCIKHMDVAVVILCSLFPISCRQKSTSNKAASQDSDSKNKDNQPSSTQPGILVYSELKSLPACNKDTQSSVVYVTEKQSLYTCNKTEWTPVATETKTEVVVEQSVTDTWRKIWQTNIRSIAYIESKYMNTACTQYEAGSGFVAANNLVATNGHVVSPTITVSPCGVLKLTEVRLWFPVDTKGDTQHTSRGSDASAVQVDRSIASSNDTVLLNTNTGGRPPLTLSSDNVSEDRLTGAGAKFQDEILHLGYSGASTFVHFVTGKINQIQMARSDGGNGFLAGFISDGLISEGRMIYEYDLVAGAGASGGPILNLKGEAIGINFAGNTSDADTEFGFAVMIAPLVDLLKATRVWQTLSP